MEEAKTLLVIFPFVIYTPNFSYWTCCWVGGKSQSARMRKWFWNYVEWNIHREQHTAHSFQWAAQKVQKHGKNKLLWEEQFASGFHKFCTFLTVTPKDYGKNWIFWYHSIALLLLFRMI